MGETTEIEAEAKGYISLTNEVCIQLWLSQPMIERMIRLVELSSRSLGWTVCFSLNAVPVFRGSSICADVNTHQRFKAGEIPAQIINLPILHIVKRDLDSGTLITTA